MTIFSFDCRWAGCPLTLADANLWGLLITFTVIVFEWSSIKFFSILYYCLFNCSWALTVAERATVGTWLQCFFFSYPPPLNYLVNLAFIASQSISIYRYCSYIYSYYSLSLCSNYLFWITIFSAVLSTFKSDSFIYSYSRFYFNIKSDFFYESFTISLDIISITWS